MPNRYVRESWIESAAVDSLDAPAERFFLRLILKADDFGRYTANPVALKNTLYPLKDDVRATDSSRWLAACEKAGLVRCYETAKGRFLEIPKFGQRARATVSKFPGPDEVVPGACQTNDGQTSDIGQSSAPEDEDEDDIRGRERGAPAGQIPSRNSRFVPPEATEVALQCAKIGLPDAEGLKFLSYYGANGWKVGRNPMKSWPHALQNWKANWEERRGGPRKDPNADPDWGQEKAK